MVLLWVNGPKPTQLPPPYHYLLIVILANCGQLSIVWLAVPEHSVRRVLRVCPVQRVAIVGLLKCPLPHFARLVHMGH